MARAAVGRLALLGLAVVAVLGGWVVLALGLGAYVVVHLVPECVALSRLAPAAGDSLRHVLTRLLATVGPPASWPEPLASAARRETGSTAADVSRLAMRAAASLALLPRLVAGAGLSVVAAYLILVEGPLTPRIAALVAGSAALTDGAAVLALAARAAWRLASAELLLATFTAGASAAAFWLLGAAVPLVLGLMAGMLDLIPYAGPAVLLLPWGAFLLATGHGARALAVVAAWLALAGVRGVLELRWVGRGVGLSSLWVLVSFYLGARAFGLSGLLLGPVVAAALWAVWRQDEGGAAADGNRHGRGQARSRRLWYAFSVGPRWSWLRGGIGR
jgi:predicted PurR-regulated permease PerM